jgi:hypothetical protein
MRNPEDNNRQPAIQSRLPLEADISKDASTVGRSHGHQVNIQRENAMQTIKLLSTLLLFPAVILAILVAGICCLLAYCSLGIYAAIKVPLIASGAIEGDVRDPFRQLERFLKWAGEWVRKIWITWKEISFPA